MKIRFIQTLSTDREVFRAGNEYDVPSEDAIRYINSSIARKTAEGADEPALTPSLIPASPLKPSELIGEKQGVPDAKPTRRSKQQPPAPAMPPAPVVPVADPAAPADPAS